MDLSLLSTIALILPCAISTAHYFDLEERIVNGVPISADQYPWMASMRDIYIIDSTLYAGPHSCGASLIEVDPYPVVLTAAHCFDGYILNETDGSIKYENSSIPVSIALDFNRTTQQQADFEPHPINITEQYHTLYVEDASMIRIHPKWNKTGGGLLDGYDIALFIIDDNQTIDIDINPLPTIPMQLTPLESCCYSNENLTQIGYGIEMSDGDYTPTLESTVLSYVDGVDCIEAFKAAGNTSIIGPYLVKRYPDEIPNKFVCAYGNGTDTCQGDSGGPLFTVNDEDGSIEIVGVVSFGEGCAAGYPGFWTSTGHFYNWVYNTIDGITTTSAPSMEPTESPQEVNNCDGDYTVAADCQGEDDLCDDDARCFDCNWQYGEEVCSDQTDVTCTYVLEDCQCTEVFVDGTGETVTCDTPTEADESLTLMVKMSFITMIISWMWV